MRRWARSLSGVSMVVPQPVAPTASRDDVARVAATFAPRHQMLSGRLKPTRLPNGQAMPRSELGRAIEPHRGITIEAAAVLFGEGGTPQTNHDGMTHGKHSAVKRGVPVH